MDFIQAFYDYLSGVFEIFIPVLKIILFIFVFLLFISHILFLITSLIKIDVSVSEKEVIYVPEKCYDDMKEIVSQHRLCDYTIEPIEDKPYKINLSKDKSSE